jgi:hypothetical protein
MAGMAVVVEREQQIGYHKFIKIFIIICVISWTQDHSDQQQPYKNSDEQGTGPVTVSLEGSGDEVGD